MPSGRHKTAIFVLSAVQIVLLISGFTVLDMWAVKRLNGELSQNHRHGSRYLLELVSKRYLSTSDLDESSAGAQEWLDTFDLLPQDSLVLLLDDRTGRILAETASSNGDLLLDWYLQADWSTICGVSQCSFRDAIEISESTNATLSSSHKKSGELYSIALRALPDSNHAVAIVQRESQVVNAAESLVTWLRILLAGMATALVALTLLVNFALLRSATVRIRIEQRRREAELRKRARAITRARNAVIVGLAKLSESRDSDTDSHLDRIREYTSLLSQQLEETQAEVTPEYTRDLALASALHDIGKVGIPDKILLKPGALTSEERQVVNEHSSIGGNCLSSIQAELGHDQFIELAKQVAYHHHERWDGLGYPSGLTGEEIPLAARIVCVADVYDALTTERPYKRAMPHTQAVEIISEGAGRQFDPQVVEAFFACEEEFRKVKHRYGITEEVEDSMCFLSSLLDMEGISVEELIGQDGDS